jgi:hypothetical protein
MALLGVALLSDPHPMIVLDAFDGHIVPPSASQHRNSVQPVVLRPWETYVFMTSSINCRRMAPKTPKVEAKDTAKGKKIVAKVKKETVTKEKKPVEKVKKVKDEAGKAKAALRTKTNKESSAKAKKAIEKIKAKKEADANYRKGVEVIRAKQEVMAKENKAVEKLTAKERRLVAAKDRKNIELKSKAESSTHKEHEKQPQPRWK